MAENNTREKVAASKPCWGSVRWADISISDASNSWIYTQGDTKNESKSVGLTSLLQKNIKLNDSYSEFHGGKTIVNETSTFKVPNKGFLTANCKTTDNKDRCEEPNLSQSSGIVSSESYEGIEKGQETENEEIRFGEGMYQGSLCDSNQISQAIKSLIQSASLGTPKIFGDSPQNINKDPANNKKRIKDYTESPEDIENVNINSEIQDNRTTIFKKIKHSKINVCTTEPSKPNREIGQITIQERNTQKKVPSSQLSTPRRTKNTQSKSPSIDTPKTPPYSNSNRNDSSIEHTVSSNVDWNKRISSRLFQIAIGKGTKAYQNFLKLKPKKEDREASDPQTPNAHIRCPQKQFTDQLNQWRKSLHKYDDPDSNVLEL